MNYLTKIMEELQGIDLTLCLKVTAVPAAALFFYALALLEERKGR